MPGFVEDRKRRLASVARLVEKNLGINGKANYEKVIIEIQFSLGVTDKKAREYLQLIIAKFDLTTEMEETRTGRIYWIKTKEIKGLDAGKE